MVLPCYHLSAAVLLLPLLLLLLLPAPASGLKVHVKDANGALKEVEIPDTHPHAADLERRRGNSPSILGLVTVCQLPSSDTAAWSTTVAAAAELDAKYSRPPQEKIRQAMDICPAQAGGCLGDRECMHLFTQTFPDSLTLNPSHAAAKHPKMAAFTRCYRRRTAHDEHVASDPHIVGLMRMHCPREFATIAQDQGLLSQV